MDQRWKYKVLQLRNFNNVAFGQIYNFVIYFNIRLHAY
jgi:hypothetical protein